MDGIGNIKHVTPKIVSPKQTDKQLTSQPTTNEPQPLDKAEINHTLTSHSTAPTKNEQLISSTSEDKAETAKPSIASGAKSTVSPPEIDGAYVIGLSGVAGAELGSKLGSITATGDLNGLHGINSTTLTTLSGKRVASVNPLEPVTARKRVAKAPLDGLNGLGSTELYTLKGRTITVN